MINDFSGDSEFLRNDYPCNVLFDGEVYPSVHHAFQAAKTSDLNLREQIKNASTKESTKLGRNVQLSPTWNDDRVSVMETLQKSKFNDNFNMKLRLLKTHGCQLVQGGMQKDTFWGVDENGVGENHNGKILMKMRDEIIQNEGTAEELFEKWLEKAGLDFMLEPYAQTKSQT